ncbi:hypothetical protein CB1_000518005 [Camelus ferus]|nr:hypothetical protein CB1_000518005 [Camelus ferus]
MLLLVALSVFLARSRKSGGQGGGRKWFETWDENTVGTFLKLGFEDDGTVKDGDFHVALENVDSNVRMHIHRSEVTSSSL